MNDPALVLVAHGTRSSRGVEMIAALAEAVSARVGETRVAFVDVLGPSPQDVLTELDAPAVVVPAFLASGYHVHHDVHGAAAQFPGAVVTPALGPDPVLAQVLRERLVEAGWTPGDAVVLAAAGSSDPRALADVRRSAAMLASLLDQRVRIGYVATGTPTVGDAVRGAREDGASRVFVASYLLAHGLFHERLFDAGADGVTQPLGVHPRIVDLVAARHDRAAVLTRS
ncbi:sirohydrochlorin chelatase [Rhodococcus triatomae]|uniref:Sirohydrochlorin ferrochelatase n=1 Tax=Rhodococcus triatomae TaxID=300028 RepID=A0A1G8F5I3_9NOCA|nr:sirohydrochlorin chelatase [Rhodococcus triatomae]QNG19395.1 sirohydrochlorin chelatase [Rhodococcus triatomae]QNG24692.1 sirohydrochlorin chelatase [Rhodococcus triatomae]SDH77443.1 Sirohydrochlorin ferrochelatase [Rhodococcus triatomae]